MCCLHENAPSYTNELGIQGPGAPAPARQSLRTLRYFLRQESKVRQDPRQAGGSKGHSQGRLAAPERSSESWLQFPLSLSPFSEILCIWAPRTWGHPCYIGETVLIPKLHLWLTTSKAVCFFRGQNCESPMASLIEPVSPSRLLSFLPTSHLSPSF